MYAYQTNEAKETFMCKVVEEKRATRAPGYVDVTADRRDCNMSARFFFTSCSRRNPEDIANRASAMSMAETWFVNHGLRQEKAVVIVRDASLPPLKRDREAETTYVAPFRDR